ncbi:protein spaetzle 3-like [Planococcus citri]|uniref:protein spaetzle 3-like n=1 Tax=Planococcus citri TaxID=170843 RepID=UPI0031F90D7B
MSVQNFSLPYSSAGYFGVPETASPSPVYYTNAQQNVPPKLFGFEDRQTSQQSVRKPYQSYQPTYTRVTGGTDPRNGKTSVHVVVDYDDDFNDDRLPTVTPIQGPIFLKNGSVPVVPLYSYPKVNNGSLVQIPIMWAALSLALGYEIRGDIIRGAPCIKRYHQLFCPTAGNSYPIERIEKFIDDNKALMRRMYGEFETSNVDYGPQFNDPQRNKRTRNYPPQPPSATYGGESYFSRILNKRQTLPKTPQSESGRLDSCESKLEVVTPYWASNSAGKVRAIVNTQHFEQAIHQEVCSKSETPRCSNDCRCEQKYKWHRLLSYDPDNDCKGIFMDWFLFPSCCVCRCSPLPN